MTRNVSLVTRVARSAAAAACVSALSAAVATSALGGFLLQQAEDRRLLEAARDLVFLLGDADLDRREIRDIVRHEHDETKHAGIRFTVSDPSGVFIAGEAGVEQSTPGGCSTRGEDRLRTCSVATGGAKMVTAASVHTPQSWLFVLATILALAFSALVTWFWCRPMVRSAIAPFSRLRSRVAAIDIELAGSADLGSIEHVIEVDELRSTIAQLLGRVGMALEQSQRFAANAAHELRTPLTAARVELELLGERRSLPAEVAGDLATVRAKVSDLVVLVDKLLVLATPTRILNEPNEIVSLRDVMEDVVHGLPREQRHRVTLGNGDALVRGDATLLGSMFSNALGNALEFGVSARVDLVVTNGVAAITIDDDGPGLDEADWDRVFEPFFCDAAALRRRKSGHGLGLALVRHIAASHGGSASFRRREGSGARLELLLPEMID